MRNQFQNGRFSKGKKLGAQGRRPLRTDLTEVPLRIAGLVLIACCALQPLPVVAVEQPAVKDGVGSPAESTVPFEVGQPDFGVKVVDQPTELLIVRGIIGSSTFRKEFKLRASRKIDRLTVAPGSLKEEQVNAWIAGESVKVTPSSTNFEKGEEKLFTVTVSNVTMPGIFEGSIVFQQGDTKGYVELRVDAVKLNLVPKAIEVHLENEGWLLGGGVSTVTQPFSLNPEVERASSRVLTDLRSQLELRLDPMQHDTKKWLNLKFDAPVLNLANPSEGADSLTFTRSDMPPGSYSGNLRLTSGEFGTVATIPVAVKVRGSARQAWLFMLIGILSSWAITYWQTTGKTKNALRATLARIHVSLEKSPLTSISRMKVEQDIARAHDLIDGGRLTEAQAKVAEIPKTLQAAIEVSRKLTAKAAEVQSMLGPIQSLKHALEDLFDSGSVFLYLDGIRQRVERLQLAIQQGDFTTEKDPRLINQFDGAEKAIRDLEAIVENHRRLANAVDGMASTFAEAFPSEAALASDLTASHTRAVTERLQRVSHVEDLRRLTGRIVTVRDKLDKVADIIDRLRRFQEILSGMVNPPIEAQEKIQRLVTDLRAGLVPQQAKVEEVANLIGGGEATRSAAAAGLRAPLKLNSTVPRIELLGRRGFGPFSPEDTGPGAENPPPQNGWALRAYWRSVRAWFTPDRVETVVKAMLYLVALVILVPIGMSQTYLKSDTFGATNGSLEYLFVFLWGFGIQASTATAASVLTKIRGR